MIDQYIQQYGRRLYGLCRSLCASPYDADDLYQETWLRVVKHITQYDPSREFEPWLTRICANTYRSTLRRLAKSPLLDFSNGDEKDRLLASIPAPEEQYTVCPHCGAKLRPACPNCSFPVEVDWKVCPKCATPLDKAELHHTPPLRQRDRSLSKILIAIIVVPVALIALAVFGLTAFQSATSFTSLGEATFEEYDQEQESETAREAVHEWLDSLDLRSDRAYALRYDYTNDLGGGYEYYYLFYIPGGGRSPSTSFGTDPGLFGATLNLRLERTGSSGSLYCVQTSAERTPKPRIVLGGKHIPCEVQVVDYNPTLFFIEPSYAKAEPGSAELPERLSVVKIVGNAVTGGDGSSAAASSNAGVFEVTDEDVMLKILTAIDSGERVPMEQIPDYGFKDGFEIVVEYQIQEDLIMHPEMARHLVFMDDGICYLIDDRVTNSANGNAYRIMGEDFYTLLEGLFQ